MHAIRCMKGHTANLYRQLVISCYLVLTEEIKTLVVKRDIQATVLRSGVALVAYELASRFWRQGIGSSAVSAMLQELRSNHSVHLFTAVPKATNYRSLALLRCLGFQPATAGQAAEFGTEPDELVMVKSAAAVEHAA
jgi:ribosomal-protein-alanine N-acetyltransferase